MSLFDDVKRFRPLKKVYMQMFEGAFINEAAYNAYHGFKNLRFELVPVEHGEFSNMEMEENSMACGGVKFMQDAFRKMGIGTVAALDIPEAIESFCQRKITHTTLRKLIESNPKFPLFVKPDGEGKLFDGTVVTNVYELEMFQHYAGLDIGVIHSEVLSIVSEHRAFITDGRIVDVDKYKGKYGTHPSLEVMENCMRAWKDAPVAYGLDFGVLDDGQTVLIEANDAYALGSYGLNSYDYTKMLILRWKEIVGSKVFG